MQKNASECNIVTFSIEVFVSLHDNLGNANQNIQTKKNLNKYTNIRSPNAQRSELAIFNPSLPRYAIHCEILKLFISVNSMMSSLYGSGDFEPKLQITSIKIWSNTTIVYI